MKERLRSRCSLILAMAIFSIIASHPASVFAKLKKLREPKEFTADATIQEGNAPEQVGKIYFSHGRVRIEAPASGGDATVTIIRPDEEKIFLSYPDKKQFALRPYKPFDGIVAEAMRSRASRTLIGPETIGGIECQKFEVTPKNPAIAKFTICQEKVTLFPVEILYRDNDPANNRKIDWKNVKAAKVPPILFEPPSAYRLVRPGGASGAPVSSSADHPG